MESRWSNLRDLWQATVYTPIEPEFEAAWKELTLKYWNEYPKIISYLANNWIYFKEKIYLIWTNKISYYDNITTGRAESIHYTIKKELPSRLLHLNNV
jgi:hypothetical protein